VLDQLTPQRGHFVLLINFSGGIVVRVRAGCPDFEDVRWRAGLAKGCSKTPTQYISRKNARQGFAQNGAVKVAQVIAAVDTPHRFRSKRQFWAYCGLAVVTKASAEYRIEDGKVRKAATTF
jgi:hypothetical protein